MELPDIWTCWQPSNTSSVVRIGAQFKGRNAHAKTDCQNWEKRLQLKKKANLQLHTANWVKECPQCWCADFPCALEKHLDFGWATVANDCGRIYMYSHIRRRFETKAPFNSSPHIKWSIVGQLRWEKMKEPWVPLSDNYINTVSQMYHLLSRWSNFLNTPWCFTSDFHMFSTHVNVYPK